MNVAQALDAADEGEKEGLRGLYPTVGQVLAAEVRHLQARVNQQARFSEKAIEALQSELNAYKAENETKAREIAKTLEERDALRAKVRELEGEAYYRMADAMMEARKA